MPATSPVTLSGIQPVSDERCKDPGQDITDPGRYRKEPWRDLCH
jgi:hypothetical protein